MIRESLAMGIGVVFCFVGGALTMAGFCCFEPAFVNGDPTGGNIMSAGIVMLMLTFVMPLLAEENR